MNSSLYTHTSQMVFGFHGCDIKIRDKVLNSTNEPLYFSTNDYDWLGNGVYFWLNDPIRAYNWAKDYSLRRPDKIQTPSVIGAIISLGNCLNFSEQFAIQLAIRSYNDLIEKSKKLGIKLKCNSQPDEGGCSILRRLDCAVIENIHKEIEEADGQFDTVYGYFQESSDAYTGAGIKAKSHIQLCVRNLDCIKGYFLPRELATEETYNKAKHKL
jgi:hypothetical protein